MSPTALRHAGAVATDQPFCLHSVRTHNDGPRSDIITLKKGRVQRLRGGIYDGGKILASSTILEIFAYTTSCASLRRLFRAIGYSTTSLLIHRTSTRAVRGSCITWFVLLILILWRYMLVRHGVTIQENGYCGSLLPLDFRSTLALLSSWRPASAASFPPPGNCFTLLFTQYIYTQYMSSTTKPEEIRALHST